MKKFLTIISLLLISLLIFNCSQTGQNLGSANAKSDKRPVWMDNPHKLYPDSKYLVAIGAGDTRQDAENIAAGNLSRIFESKVKVDHTMKERYKSLSKGTEFVSEELTTESNENVNIKSDQSLVNVKFGKSYIDKMARIHVLAYLNRAETASIYAGKINTANNQILYFSDKSEKSNDILEQYAYLNAAMILSLNNKMLLDQLQVISHADYKVINANKGYDHNEIKNMVSDLAQKITFSVNIKNDPDDRVKVLLEEIIGELSFNLSNDPILNIDGKVSYEDLDLQRGNLKFVGWELNIKMTNNADDVLITIVEKGREGGLDNAGAKRNAVKQIGKIINKKFKKQLTGYFDGKVVK
ncbi:MAG: hypothetical protein U9R41_05520 [Candidatus Marinimicrobia bacterium]|nr:hypothetical protein [Candidatus Neomarinimicrobiota bacterium]